MPRALFFFDDHRLDVGGRTLWRNGVRVHVTPVVFDLIAYLIANRARAVGRDELVAAVWGKREISDTMLGKAILSARRAVGDTADAQALIRTIPRFGYHWLAEAREEMISAPVEAPRGPRRIARGWLIGGPIAMLALFAFAVILHERDRGAATRAALPAAAPSIDDAGAMLVLPVAVVAGSDDAWLRLGLMDLIVNRLCEAGVAVMSSDSVVSLLSRTEATSQRMIEAVSRLEPRAHVVRTSIAKTSTTWVVHMELIEASGQARGVDASGAGAVTTARDATDRLLDLLGRHSVAESGHAELSLDELLQRTEAARLADDLDGARTLLDRAPAALKTFPQVRLRHAQIDARGGRFEEAQIELENLLAEATEADAAVLRAQVLLTLCHVQSRLDHLATAIGNCSDAITLLETRDAPQVLAMAYNNRANIHLIQNDFDAAEADFARSHIAFERSGDVLALLRLDGNEASVAIARGRPGEALSMVARAAGRFEQLGLVNEALTALCNEIEAQIALLNPAAALVASERGWALLGRVRDTGLADQFRVLRANALAANGRLAEAHALLSDVISDSSDDEQRATLALARTDLARLELGAGNAGVAAAIAVQAEQALALPQYEQAYASNLLTEIRALRRAHRNADAFSASTRLEAAAKAAAIPVVSLQALLAASENPDEDAAAADSQHESALAMATDIGAPYLIAESVMSYGEALIERGELEHAVVVIGRIARYAADDFDCSLLQTKLYLALGQQDAWQKALARSRRLAGERGISAVLATFAAPTFAAPSNGQ